MKTFLKIFGLAVVVVLVLSITIKNKTLFHYVYQVISPATQSAQDATESFFNRSVSSTHSYSKKLFDNSVPKVKDSVESKASGFKKNVGEPAEKITEDEKAELADLIKSH
jgi:hypothetical protein